MIIVRRGVWVAAHNGLPRSILSLSIRIPGFFDFRSFSSTGHTEVEDDTFEGARAIKLIIGRDFAVTRSSPESC